MTTELVDWCKAKHSSGKHAVILADGYDRVELSASLREFFPGHISAGPVDFIVGEWWVSIRPLLDNVPVAFMKDPKVGVCVVRKNE